MVVSMLSLSIVYAAPQLALAREIADYLTVNCGVDAEQIEVVNRDLLDAVGRALGADVVVVILSPDAVPPRMARESWEPVFADAPEKYGTEIAYIPAVECAFPKVLLRSNVFPPAPDGRASARALKRWLFELRPPVHRAFYVTPGDTAADIDLESLYNQFGDRPATASVSSAAIARAFATLAREDFASVFWVDCRGCSLAEASGELAAQLAVRTPGDLAANMERLRTLCSQHRCLLILEGPNEELAEAFSEFGRSSVMLVQPGDPLPPVDALSAARTRHALAGWVNRPLETPGSGEIRRTLLWLLDDCSRWPEARNLARAAIAYYKFNDRFAEAFEVLGLICTAGIEREWAVERAWILESWGVRIGRQEPEQSEDPVEQLALF